MRRPYRTIQETAPTSLLRQGVEIRPQQGRVHRHFQCRCDPLPLSRQQHTDPVDPETGSRHHRRLANGQDTWSARCVETRTPGAAGGPGKLTGSDPGRAPRSDPTEAVENCVAQHRTCLTEPAEDTSSDNPAAVKAGPAADDVPDEPVEGPRAIKRRECHAAVHALYDKGVQIEVIARALGPEVEPGQGRGQRQQGEADQKGRMRPGRIRPPPTPHPPCRLSTVTLRHRPTRSGSEPNEMAVDRYTCGRLPRRPTKCTARALRRSSEAGGRCAGEQTYTLRQTLFPVGSTAWAIPVRLPCATRISLRSDPSRPAV